MRNFQSQASRYDNVSDPQIELSEALFDMALDALPETPPVFLDLGCGTGHLSLDLASLCPVRLDCLDLAPAMLEICQQKLQEHFPGSSYRLLEGDAETFDPDCAYDAIFSSAAIQWFHSLPAFLARANKWLKPAGTLALGTFGPRTLEELGRAYQSATGRPLTSPTRFLSENSLAGLCKKSGFQIEDSATCLYTQQSDSPRDFLRSLKQMGVTGSQNGPALNRSQLKALESALARTATPEAPVNITWELVVVVATKAR